MTEETKKKLEPELSTWLEHKHSLELWLPLSIKLAEMISNDVEGALEYRDELLKSLEK